MEEEEEEAEEFDTSDEDYKGPNSKAAEAEQRLMNARQKAMKRPHYDIPLLIPPLFQLTPNLKDQLWERFITLTNDQSSVRAKRFLFMLHNSGQDYSQTLWNDKMKPDLLDLGSTEQQSVANLPPLQMLDIVEESTEDLLVQTSSQPHSNIVEPAAVDANAITNRKSGEDRIDDPIDFISHIENYHGAKGTIENAIQAYSAPHLVQPIPKPLAQEDKVDLFWKTLCLLPNDITHAKEDLPEAWWRDTVFVPLIFQFRQVLDATRFEWIAETTIAITTKLESKSGRTDGGIVLRNNNELLAILFEYKKDNLSKSHASTALATDQASRYCYAGLASRHALYPHANHKVMAIIGEGSKITAACASMKDNELAMESLTNPKEWNLRRFDEIFNFAVFLTSLSSFLKEEEAKCQPPKRPRIATDDDDEQTRASKKAKIDSVPCPFVVPFSQRKAIDGTFASYSRGLQGDNNNRLISILEHTELNTQLLQNNSNVIVSRSLSPIVALVTMQGCIGVPKLLAYRCFDRNSGHMYSIETTNLSEMPEPALPLKDMIAQYAKALIEQHKHCLSLGRDCSIRWKGQEIKFIQWNYCGFRGDCCASLRDMPADSMLDLVHLGNAIQRWSEQLNSIEFLPLANNLMNACPYQRVSPEYVLRVLENQSLLDQVVELPRKSFKNALLWCSEAKLNALIKRKMYAAAKKKSSMSLQNIQWNDEVIKENIRQGTAMAGTNRIKIIGKTLKIAFSIHWGAALEFTISKLMSGKQYFPKLLEYKFTHDDNIPLDNKIDTLLLIFPEYNKEPKQRNIFRKARQLLTAIKMIHEKRIIHSDIAPPNVLWDDNDDLVLIDFGSTFWFNYLPPYEEGTSQCMLRDYGHQGFAPREKVRLPVTDVFSAGRLIEHWANEWNQMTPELNSLIQAMTYDEWYRRVDLDDALARLNQVEQYQYQKACEIEETNDLNVRGQELLASLYSPIPTEEEEELPDEQNPKKLKYQCNCLIVGDVSRKPSVIESESDLIPDEERIELKNAFIEESCNTLQKIIDVSKKLKIKVNCDLASISKIIANPNSVSAQEMSYNIKSLIYSPGIQQLITEAKLYERLPSIEYYINNIEQLHNNFPASDFQLLMMDRFSFKQGKYTWTMKKHNLDEKLDVSRISRLTAIIYVIDLHEWNLPSAIDPTKTRLKQQIKDWKHFTNAAQFKEMPCIVVLDNVDLFEHKFNDDPVLFRQIFDAFNGDNTVIAAMEYIRRVILSKRRKGDNNPADAALTQFYELNAQQMMTVQALFNHICDIVFKMSAQRAGVF